MRVNGKIAYYLCKWQHYAELISTYPLRRYVKAKGLDSSLEETIVQTRGYVTPLSLVVTTGILFASPLAWSSQIILIIFWETIEFLSKYTRGFVSRIGGGCSMVVSSLFGRVWARLVHLPDCRIYCLIRYPEKYRREKDGM